MNESIFFSGDHFVAGKKKAMNLTNNYFEPVVTRILNKGFTWLIQVITIHSDDVCRRVSSIRLHSEQGSHHKQQWRLACHGAVSPHMYITFVHVPIRPCSHPSIQMTSSCMVYVGQQYPWVGQWLIVINVCWVRNRICECLCDLIVGYSNSEWTKEGITSKL